MVPFPSVFVLSLTLAIAHSVDLSNIIGNYLEGELQEETTNFIATPDTATTNAIPTGHIAEESFWIPNIRDVVTQFNLFVPQTDPVVDVTEPVDNLETTTAWVWPSNTTTTLTTLVPDLEEATSTPTPNAGTEEPQDAINPIEWNPSVELAADLPPPSTEKMGPLEPMDFSTGTTQTTIDAVESITIETTEFNTMMPLTTQVPDLGEIISTPQPLGEDDEPQGEALRPIEWNLIEELSEDLTPPSASPAHASTKPPPTTFAVPNLVLENIEATSDMNLIEETTLEPKLEETTSINEEPQPGQIYGEILVGDKAPLVEDDPNGMETNNLTPMEVAFPCLDSKASASFFNDSSELESQIGSPGLVFTAPTTRLGQNGVTFDRVIVRGICCWETFRRIRFTGKMIRICPGKYSARDITGSVWRVRSLRPVDHFAQRRKELQGIGS